MLLAKGKGEHVVVRKGMSDKLAHIRVAAITCFYGIFVVYGSYFIIYNGADSCFQLQP